jgi:hypothetical protein
MRTKVPLAVAILFNLVTIPLCAAGIDNKPLDMQSIQALEARALLAQPREQCFLYAELLHQMTELSQRQYAAGDVTNATDMLKHVQQIAQKVHLVMAANDKRLKNAEILLRHTAFRLNEMLHGSSFEDRPLLEATLTKVNQAENEAMMQVFRNR